MVIRFSVNGDFKTGLHHLLETLDILKLIGSNEGIIYMYPHIDASHGAYDLEEKAGIRHGAGETFAMR